MAVLGVLERHVRPETFQTIVKVDAVALGPCRRIEGVIRIHVAGDRERGGAGQELQGASVVARVGHLAIGPDARQIRQVHFAQLAFVKETADVELACVVQVDLDAETRAENLVLVVVKVRVVVRQVLLQHLEVVAHIDRVAADLATVHEGHPGVQVDVFGHGVVAAEGQLHGLFAFTVVGTSDQAVRLGFAVPTFQHREPAHTRPGVEGIVDPEGVQGLAEVDVRLLQDRRVLQHGGFDARIHVIGVVRVEVDGRLVDLELADRTTSAGHGAPAAAIAERGDVPHALEGVGHTARGRVVHAGVVPVVVVVFDFHKLRAKLAADPQPFLA